jgi:hypothetical protein
MLGSNLGWRIGCDWGFPQFLQANFGILSRLGPPLFLPNPFQFIILSCHSTLYESSVKVGWFYSGFLLSLFFRPWRCRRYVPPKLRSTLNWLHGVISQKTVLFITTAVRTSNPTFCMFFTPIRATYLTQLTLPGLIILPISDKEYKLLNSSFGNFLQPPRTSVLFILNVLLGSLFSDTHSLRSSLNVWNRVSQQWKSTGKISPVYFSLWKQ